ncbi:translation initiation factor eIF-2B subunit beta [Artemisia annua]|uniref:Translation initiation factor eIF2B subunit beta n=1 Tax=Artemisia annua TaxID=35608 RepID=A0A2U1QFU0_ARTAN|nr:translation initiation factor eIF-2B subunit beta [Artemisia annua]
MKDWQRGAVVHVGILDRHVMRSPTHGMKCVPKVLDLDAAVVRDAEIFYSEVASDSGPTVLDFADGVVLAATVSYPEIAVRYVLKAKIINPEMGLRGRGLKEGGLGAEIAAKRVMMYNPVTVQIWGVYMSKICGALFNENGDWVVCLIGSTPTSWISPCWQHLNVCFMFEKSETCVLAVLFWAYEGIVGDHAVMANGRVIAPVGLNMVALAAQRHVVPFFVDLAGIHKDRGVWSWSKSKSLEFVEAMPFVDNTLSTERIS